MHFAEGVSAFLGAGAANEASSAVTGDKLPDLSSSSCSSRRETGWWFVGKAKFVHSFSHTQAGHPGDIRRSTPARGAGFPIPAPHLTNMMLVDLSVLPFFM